MKDARGDEVDAVVKRVLDWACRRGDVRGLALVGSWAHGAPHAGSDVDLVLLSTEPSRYTQQDHWLDEVGPASPIRTVSWGSITERRFALPSGLEVDLGIGKPAWASLYPLDAGTQKVVSDGMRPLYDPDGILAELVAAVRGD